SNADPPNATLPNGHVISTNDNRISAGMVRIGNLLYLTQAVDVSGRSGIRFTVLNSATNAVVQEGTIADPNLSFYFPSIAVNNAGDAVIGFSGSDSTTQNVATYAAVSTGSSLSFGTPVKLTPDALLGPYTG